MPTSSRASQMAHDIRDAVHALKAPPCRLSTVGMAALRRLESIAQSLDDSPNVEPGLPPGESDARNEVCDALTEAIVFMGELGDAAGEETMLDIRRDGLGEPFNAPGLTVRALMRLLTTCDPEGRDGPLGEITQRTWRRVGLALSRSIPAPLEHAR